MNRMDKSSNEVEKPITGEQVCAVSQTRQRIFMTALDPIKLLQLVNEDDYERIIEEWQRSFLEKEYTRVERLGGKGDKGRDIVCTLDSGEWVNYQCKHYDRKLNESDILLEVGKFCYYCSKGDYPPPKKYYFVSPLGVTISLRDLFKSPERLKNELKNNWDKQCRNKIVSSSIELDATLLKFIEKLDFGIFGYVSETEFIDQFKKTPDYTKRFGFLYKPRPILEKAPAEIQAAELNYIQKILDAYSDYLHKNIDAVTKLHSHPDLEEDFNRQRLYFYSAEYLNAYARDTFAPELQYFEKLKDDVYHSIIEEIHEDAEHGFARLKKVLKMAGLLTIHNNALSSEITVRDKKGICHHLANERDDVKWIQ